MTTGLKFYLATAAAFAGSAASAEPLVLDLAKEAVRNTTPAPAVTTSDLPPSQVYQAVPAPSFSQPVPSLAPPVSTPVTAAPAVAPSVYVQPAARVPATPAQYRQVFAAIRDGRWSMASAMLDGMHDGPLHATARAELYLAKGSPRVEAGPLLALIEAAPDLPQASQLAALARSRGAQVLPYLPPEQRLVSLTASPRRERERAVAGDPVSDSLRLAAEPLIKADQPAELEALLIAREPYLTPDARTEWQQRTAWIYYVVGNYAGARRLAEAASRGSGEWSTQGDWVLGLTTWRTADCDTASAAFGRVAARARDSELRAAGQYWGARAELRCGRPEGVQARMREAARNGETFYGLLAGAYLGLKPKLMRSNNDAALTALNARPNVRAATILADIGENRLAEQALRHQARIGRAADHNGLVRLAGKLSLASAQYWLAHNGPQGAVIYTEDRYPAPRYNPQRGWRVDKALVFAHTLQESGFRTAVVSPAGATGLMQVRPGTAGDIARARGEYFSTSQLTDPTYNIEYGQSYLEQLRDRSATGGLLPKVIAAYNAGPVPVERWNQSVRDGGDPLLYIESLPYWETRGYVPTILRNYWIYQAHAGEASPSLTAMAQGKWPLFPSVGRRVASADEGQVELRP
ncbi:MAG TPA: transglycosylase SLT domain-containing protein [Sphingomonadaceae bacterium]|nr:transglycosylase SLT domain-containing protein [Sphingomonadaceae bacterium]